MAETVNPSPGDWAADENAPTEGVCLGLCCSAFPITGQEARRQMIEFIAGRAEFWINDKGEKCTHTVTDPRVSLEFLNDMLIPLGRFANDDTRRELHDCRHWDKDTKLCTIYDQRPSLCRTYPNYGACDHADKGCTYRRINPSIPSPQISNDNAK